MGKSKVDSLGMDLDCAQKETRNISSELFRVKNAYDEAVLQLEEVRRENKMLSNEIKDIMAQISEGGRSIHEIAALNLAKFRQVQTNLSGSTERADLNEQALAKTRARGPSASIGPM